MDNKNNKSIKVTKGDTTTKSVKITKSVTAPKNVKTVKSDTITKGAKITKSVTAPKSVKPAKSDITTKGAKITKSVTAPKSVKTVQSDITTKGAKVTKSVTAPKSVKTVKSDITAKGAKITKSVTAPKSVKTVKSDTTTKGAKVTKSVTAPKSVKPVKSDITTKSAKVTKSVKTVKSDIITKSVKPAKSDIAIEDVKPSNSDAITNGRIIAVNKKVTKDVKITDSIHVMESVKGLKDIKSVDNSKMKIFIVAGEFSGDIHASNLVKELRLRFPNMELYGTGGDKLKAEGQEQYYHVREMSVIGFVSVLKYLGKIIAMLRDLKKKIKEVSPDLLIFVDYPGFNLRLAKMALALKIPTVYFISPQFWVWGKNRIYKLRDYTDKVITIFPFEEDVLRGAGVNAVYVGNPVVDNIEYIYDSKESFLEDCNLTTDKPIVAIFPGSRFLEVNESIPLFLSAAKKLRDKYQFVISRSEYFKKDQFEKLMGTYKISVMKGSQYDMMKYCDIAWACSGSITLEIALFQKPMVITYNSHKLNIIIGKLLSKLRMIGLPNIIVGEKFIPELIGKDFKVDKLLKATKYIEENRESIIEKLSQVSSLFVGKTPSKSAAEEIFSLYENIKRKK